MRRGALLAASLLAGCGGQTPLPAGPVSEGPVPLVAARAETQAVATGNADAADDPAIWRNAADPAASLIVATDKKAGLYVYGLDGRTRSFLDAGRVNNVDLIETASGVLVAASDRSDKTQARVALFRLDTDAGRLLPLGSVSSGAGEAYGLCIAPQVAADGSIRMFSVLKDGTIREIAVTSAFDTPSGRLVREMKLASQAEGCVADGPSDSLFVGEEDVGIWRFALSGDETTGRKIASTGDGMLVADVEGLAVARPAHGPALLIASSQGDSSYAVFALPDGRPLGRFRIGGGAIDGTSETDGIAAMAGDFGPGWPGGLFVAQDGDNAPEAQNFKLLALDDVIGAARAGHAK